MQHANNIYRHYRNSDQHKHQKSKNKNVTDASIEVLSYPILVPIRNDWTFRWCGVVICSQLFVAFKHRMRTREMHQ